MKRAGKHTVLGRCDWVCWSAAGLGWWAAGVMLSPFQYVRRFYSVSGDSDLLATHDSFKCFVRVGDHFVQAAVRWLQGVAYGVLPQEYLC